MLPRATLERTSRERNGPGGRTQEIQRLIGRSLRAAMGTMAFGEYTIRIDCDVLQADGGTRTASITGGCVALADACAWLARTTGVPSPFGRLVAAVSVGVVEGEVRLDLAYLEDKDAGVDANVVMLEPDRFVEVQGTGEHGPSAGRSSTASWRTASGASPSSSPCSGRRSAGEAAGGHAERGEAAGDPAAARPTRGSTSSSPRTSASSRTRPRSCSRTATASRPTRGARRSTSPSDQDSRPWPTIPGSRCSTWAARPGVRSKRWAGAAGNGGGGGRREQRRAAAPAGRGAGGQARRRAIAASLVLSGRSGRCRRCSRANAPGRILEAPAGTGGFGYDPSSIRPTSARPSARRPTPRRTA